jgi:hypothetical protein
VIGPLREDAMGKCVPIKLFSIIDSFQFKKVKPLQKFKLSNNSPSHRIKIIKLKPLVARAVDNTADLGFRTLIPSGSPSLRVPKASVVKQFLSADKVSLALYPSGIERQSGLPTPSSVLSKK